MKTFKETFLMLLENDVGSVFGDGAPHTGDYTIDYAPNDNRNIFGMGEGGSRWPKKRKKGKKKKRLKKTKRGNVVLFNQRRTFPSSM